MNLNANKNSSFLLFLFIFCLFLSLVILGFLLFFLIDINHRDFIPKYLGQLQFSTRLNWGPSIMSIVIISLSCFRLPPSFWKDKRITVVSSISQVWLYAFECIHHLSGFHLLFFWEEILFRSLVWLWIWEKSLDLISDSLSPQDAILFCLAHRASLKDQNTQRVQPNVKKNKGPKHYILHLQNFEKKKLIL